MSDLTREEAKGIFKDLRGYKITLSDLSANEQQKLCDIAISSLSEDVRPNIHARWEDGYCSNCHVFIPDDLRTVLRDYCDNDFCPNCGADMRPEPYKKGE